MEYVSREAFAELAHKKPKGTLIIIGGREDKEGDRLILQEVVRRVGSNGRLVIATVASMVPEELAEVYKQVFRELGLKAKQLDVLDARTREDAYQEKNIEMVKRSTVVFMTGGDQLRITSQIGDSPVFRELYQLYLRGGTVVGTSAGAAAMSETMLFYGPGDESNKISSLGMAPGLGLLRELVIDTHFAERGRMGRLLGAVAQNPRNLGIGIDENTSIIVEHEDHFRVMGSGAVYVVDGTGITFTNLSEGRPEGVVAIHNAQLHVLGEGDSFNLRNRCPIVTADRVAAVSEETGKAPNVTGSNGHGQSKR